MSKLFDQNYSELFDKSTSYNNSTVALFDVYVGKASLYDICLRWLKTLYDAEVKGGESNKLLLKNLSFLVPHMKNIVHWVQHYENISFVNELLLRGLRYFEAPERKERIKLGEAGLVLMGEILVSRVNSVTIRAIQKMTYVDKETGKTKVFGSVEELVDNEPAYFEWNYVSSEHHLQFKKFIANLWRSIDLDVLETIKDTVDEIKTFNGDRFNKKRTDRMTKNGDNDLKLLEEIKPIEKVEPAQVKMFKPIVRPGQNDDQNVWEQRRVQQEKERQELVVIEEVSKVQDVKQKTNQNKKKNSHKKKSQNPKKTEKLVEQKVEQKEEDRNDDDYGSILKPDSTREWREDDGKGKWNTKKKYVAQQEEKKEKKKKFVSTFVLRGSKPSFKKN